jgi:hypothetical protein
LRGGRSSASACGSSPASPGFSWSSGSSLAIKLARCHPAGLTVSCWASQTRSPAPFACGSAHRVL